ncbi:EthD domain-containing protein [Ferrovibrio sp.]|uniref:EthD domain-containing protein n=1 Tax=Ferrovibrio sp. TaxID=1917215 RepID=UPI0025C5EE7C|nr:EthD domain-containing protein [Ferrovibrio sp.]
MSFSEHGQKTYRRHSLLRRNPALSREAFSTHYELTHGPLASSQEGFRQFASRYIQNHVERLPDDSEPVFDGVTMTTQIPRDDYTKGFFNHPDYANVQDDERYLFDIAKTVSLLGWEDVVLDGPTTRFKALLLMASAAFTQDGLRAASRIVANHLDVKTASALGFSKGAFSYDLLVEAWFNEVPARTDAYREYAPRGEGLPSIFLPVREVLVYGPDKPWIGANTPDATASSRIPS